MNVSDSEIMARTQTPFTSSIRLGPNQNLKTKTRNRKIWKRCTEAYA